jgi:hypothetical protein
MFDFGTARWEKNFYSKESYFFLLDQWPDLTFKKNYLRQLTNEKLTYEKLFFFITPFHRAN